MKKLLIIIDKPNWAFDIIASNLIKFNKHNFKIYKKLLKIKIFIPILKQIIIFLI